MTEVHENWERYRPWIEAAITHAGGMYNIEDIEEKISEGEMQLWPGEHCAVVTEVMIYPNGKTLNIFAGGGQTGQALEELKRMEPCFEAFAKATDCRWLMGYGRKGWERIFAPFGYKPIWTVMAKDLAN